MDRRVSRGCHARVLAPPCLQVEDPWWAPAAPTPTQAPRPPTLRNLYRRKVNQLVSIFSATDSVLEQSTWGDLGPTRPPPPQGQWSGLASEHVSPSDKGPRQGIAQVGPQSRLSSAWAGPVGALPQGWAGRAVGEPGCGWAQECPGHSGQTGCRWAGVHRHGAEGRRQGGGVGGQEHREVGGTGGQWAGTQGCRWVGPQGGRVQGQVGTQGGGGQGAGRVRVTLLGSALSTQVPPCPLVTQSGL